MRDAAITGIGAVSCFGSGLELLREGLNDGVDGIVPVRRFDLTGYQTDLAALVPEANRPDLDSYAVCVDFAVAAIREAVAQAGLAPDAMDSPRSALFLGLSPIGGDSLVHELAQDIRAALGWRCAALTFSTACCSSTAAIGAAGAWLDAGRFDRIVAGGAEAVVPGLYAGFHALGALTEGKCSPFSSQTGTTLGEGAGFLVLERSAERPLAWLQGFGLSNDAWHETAPDPSGAGLALSLAHALSDAATDAVDYVNAHGTATAANDIAETLALRTALGAVLPPVSSTKGHLGHAQAAAGALELIATLLCADDGCIPPTLRAQVKRARMPEDCVAAEVPRPHAWTRFAKNSAAFGGANATLIVGREPGPLSRDRPLYLGGVAAMGRHGVTLDELAAAWEDPSSQPIEPTIPAVRRVDTAGMDPASRLAVAAVAGALKASGIRVGRGSTDTIGVVGGLVCAAPSEKRKLDDGIEARGMINLPVSSFAKLVLNAPPSAAARALGLRGPHTAVSTGHGSGLAAVLTSAMLLRRDTVTDAIVAVGVHEPPELGPERAFGAAAGVVQASPTDLRIAGMAIAATEAEAIAAALAEAGLDKTDIRFSHADAERLGLGPGFGDMAQLAMAATAIRATRARSALVSSAGTSGMALVLVTSS